MAGRGYQCTYVCRADSAVEDRLTPSAERLPGVELTPMPLGGPWMHESLRLRQVLLEHYVEVVFVHSEREQLVASLAIRLAERAALVRRIAGGDEAGDAGPRRSSASGSRRPATCSRRSRPARTGHAARRVRAGRGGRRRVGGTRSSRCEPLYPRRDRRDGRRSAHRVRVRPDRAPTHRCAAARGSAAGTAASRSPPRDRRARAPRMKTCGCTPRR